MTARRVLRSRLVLLVVAVLMITAAAIGARLSDADSSNELVRAPLERPTRFETGTVTVSDVRVGTTLQSNQDELQTKGLFVVMNVAVRATGKDALSVSDQRLLADGDMTYLPARSLGSTVRAEPGFEAAGDLVFEVDPNRMDGLVLELWDSGLIYRYYERTQTPLGITAANAARWAAAGAGQVVVADGTVTTGLS